MGKNEKRKGDFRAHLLADILVRIGLFGMTVVIMVVNLPLRHHFCPSAPFPSIPHRP